MPETTQPPHARADVLAKRSKRLRAPVSRGLAKVDGDRVVPNGGDHGVGLLRGVSMCTRGEALGHYTWLDSDFIGSVASASADQPKGVKARFTHPSLSGDGLGTFLGRVKAGRVVGDQAVGDLHFSPAARNTPDGDLAEYVMNLAQADPESFGVSIVFDEDFEAEDEFRDEHKTVVEQEDGTSRYEFVSPDADNEANLHHARLKKLWASDCVDDPAANPDGLFHREQQFAQDGDAILAYATGLTDVAPVATAFGGQVHPDRAREFVSRFLEARGLQITPKETTTMAEEKPDEVAGEGEEQAVEQTPDAQAETTEEPTDEGTETKSETTPDSEAEQPSAEPDKSGEGEAEMSRSECKRFIEAFGAQGGQWYAEGLSFEDARGRHVEAIEADNEQLRKRLAAAGEGEQTPVEFQPDGGKPAKPGKFSNLPDGLARYAAGIKMPQGKE